VTTEGLGDPVLRVEDERLLTGRGRYGADLVGADCLHGVFVRSRHAHCRIDNIDASAACGLPGVVAIFTADDLQADNIGDIGCVTRRARADGGMIAPAPRPVLAAGIARYVGDPVALVIAESRDQAEDAAAEIILSDDALPAVGALNAAADGPLVWPEVSGNRAFEMSFGDRAAVDAAFADAQHTTRLEFEISRVTAAPLETRNAIARWNAGAERYELTAGAQSPHLLRTELAQVLGVSTFDVHVASPDVGGSFGLKNAAFPELAAILWASRRCGRPVAWRSTRGEAFASDDHARDNLWSVELAFDADARILAVRADLRANLGAYLSTFGAHCPLNNLTGLVGPYAISAAAVTVSGYFTNTSPVAAYRGAGRPEASYAIERALDAAAAELGIDRLDLRRRNLIGPEAIPWRTALGPVLDSGDFGGTMALALERADWAGFPARCADSASRGKLRGIGFANHIESAGSLVEDMAELRFDTQGRAVLFTGTAAQGQGHETAFRQLLGELLGLPFSQVRIAPSDTDAVYHGHGAFGSRSLAVVSAALSGVRDQIVDKGRVLAAHLLECSESDVAFREGAFWIVGSDRKIGLQDVARASHVLATLPRGFEPGLAARHVWRPEACSYPNGSHVCEVEVDPETGEVRLVAYTAVEDCGRVVNPVLLAGQVHGGIAQGASQILMEAIAYDRDGQLVSGSFLDYAIPRAADLPFFATSDDPHPTTTNPLGIKGAGESGTVGALPAVMSAVLDALSAKGVSHFDMPATPSRVWRAIRDAASGGA
jgi:carbon-monoxide dehydrogenase large subunit